MRQLSISMTALQWALTHYYARKHGLSLAGVMRRMIVGYARRDGSVVPEELAGFVRDKLLPRIEQSEDQRVRRELLNLVEEEAA